MVAKWEKMKLYYSEIINEIMILKNNKIIK